MKNSIFFLLGIALVSATTWAEPAVKPVSEVKLEKYLGTWNELFRIPNRFQYDTEENGLTPCLNSQAKYTRVDELQIEVENSCQRFSKQDQMTHESVKGVGSIVDGSNGAKLFVNFTGIGLLRWVGIGDGDYWILGLGPENEKGQYSWALIGEPSLQYGWILARENHLSASVLEMIFALAKENGYERGRFISTQKSAKSAHNPTPQTEITH